MKFKCRVGLLNEIRKCYNFDEYLSWRTQSHSIETKMFKKAVLRLVINICELNPAYKVGHIIQHVLKNMFLTNYIGSDSVYKTVEDVILPVLLKDHKTIECSKQVNLKFLANELGNVGRHVEAHVVRTIVKPWYEQKMVGNDRHR